MMWYCSLKNRNEGLRITAHETEIKDLPKLPSENFFYPPNVRRNPHLRP